VGLSRNGEGAGLCGGGGKALKTSRGRGENPCRAVQSSGKNRESRRDRIRGGRRFGILFDFAGWERAVQSSRKRVRVGKMAGTAIEGLVQVLRIRGRKGKEEEAG